MTSFTNIYFSYSSYVNRQPASVEDLHCYIFEIIKALFGEAGATIRFDILLFDGRSRTGVLRCDTNLVGSVRAALTISNKLVFNIIKTVESSIEVTSNTY